jgi:uncharacterized damage-inducible protein DinB
MSRPTTGSYPVNFEAYVSKVKEIDLPTAFNNQRSLINDFFDTISEEKSEHAYAHGKWTLKEMLQHIIDTERIFAYRSLCFARKETASLPGFDENQYAEHSFANARTWKSLCEEMKAVRTSTEMLFNSFSEETLHASGTANNKHMSVLSLGYVIVGHLNHHKLIIEERYL